MPKRYAKGEDLERRLAVARVLAMEHELPLGFHEEEDQLDFDRKGQALLRELDSLASPSSQLSSSTEPNKET